MALYDRYPDVMSGHGPWVQRAERGRQQRILGWIESLLPARREIRALEVGVGIGLFARACKERNWDYVGIDRNRKMADGLGEEFRMVCAEIPPWPGDLQESTFDVAYSAFVLEHLADGSAALEFVDVLRRAVKPDGVVAVVVPDALSLGLEFWNLDYTHRYPTAERNVTQILLEGGLRIDRVIRYRGPGWTGIGYWILRALGGLYSYRLWAALTRRSDLCYSIYQYIKQDILVFISRKAE